MGTVDPAAAFTEAFDAAPQGLCRAPGRVNLIGEHTDYNRGYVLPFAIDREVRIAFAVRPDRKVRLVSRLTGEVFTGDLDCLLGVSGWPAYPLGVAWGLTALGVDLKTMPGFDLAVDSDLPVGAGLSSSAALESATAIALNSMWGLGLAPLELAQSAQRGENVVVGAPTGLMDQVASLCGQPGCATFFDCHSLEIEPVSLGLVESGLAVLVIDTRVRHAHATGGYRQRRDECERAARALGLDSLRGLVPTDLAGVERHVDELLFRRIRHVVSENQRVLAAVKLLRAEGIAAIGGLLDESHASLRDDFEVSTAELDLAVTSVRAAGALGARMTGGGFGGSAIALVPAREAGKIGAAVSDAFAVAGYGAPHVFTVNSVGGAEVIN
jgi:galactokinase